MSIFIIATDDVPPADYAAEIQRQISPVLGFRPEVRLAILPDPRQPESAERFADAIAAAAPSAQPIGAQEIFILPAALEFNLWQRETLGQIVAETRRRDSAITIHHDDPDLCDPLIVDALAESAARHIEDLRSTGILLTPNGCGDPASRAQSYRLMRLLWERLGVAAGDVAFVRNMQPFLSPTLERLNQHFRWILIPQSQFETETVAYARVILENSKTGHLLADPPASDLRIASWIAARAVRLWRERRMRDDLRLRSSKSTPPEAAPTRTPLTAGSAFVAHVPDRDAMRAVLDAVLPAAPDRVIVKVTWHGYATGTYTNPAALDLLLSALPAPAVIVEGHTSSRNLGEATFDWETEAQSNRAWIRQQDSEFLRRTGLADVIARHRAQYINITECFWDEQCATPEEIRIPLHYPELAGFIPQALLDLRGSPLISFAKIKGPTRLAISNLFGLIPHPLRAAWHGPNITHFARVCCDLAKLYGSLFDLVAINEGLYSAVRWDRRGLYRSRWGNYDLITDAGHLVASRNLVAADILAARLQGQEISRSAFFDVVRAELAWDDAAEQGILPTRLHTLFV
jgi:hypothetical protein